MDLKVKRMKWMGDIYQKFEAVCQDVDDIVSQDAVKYLENGVQNVGGSMKKFYSGVVHDLLPFPKLVTPTKFEPHSVKSIGGGENDNKKNWDEQNPINNFIGALQDCKAISLSNYLKAGDSDNGGEDNHKSGDEEDPIDKFIDALQESNAINPSNFQGAGSPDSVKSVGGAEDNHKNGDEENPINNFIEALQDSNAINLANNQQAGAPESVKSVGGGEDDQKNGDEKNPIDTFMEPLQDSNVINLANDQKAGAPDSVKSVGAGKDDRENGNGENPIETFIEELQVSNAINLTNDQQVSALDSVKSIGGGEDNHKHEDEENPFNNFIEALHDYNTISLSNDKQAGVPDMPELVNHTSSETCAGSLEVGDPYVTQKEVADDSRDTAGVKKESIHAITEVTTIKSAPKLMNLISVKEKEPLEFSLHSESNFGSYDSACRVSVSTRDSKEVSVEQDSCLIVEEGDTNSSAAQLLNSTPLGKKELTKAPLFRKSSGVDKEDTGKLAQFSAASSSVLGKSTKTGPLCFRSSLISDSPYLKSLGSYSSLRGEAPQVAGQVMQSHDGLVSSSSFCQSKELNDELRISSIESRLVDIQLNDDTKLEESGVFVDDKELYAASRKVQKLRSYTKRIQDAFTSKRLAKEYEQLAIWYGDTDFESKQDLPPQAQLPFRSTVWVDPKQLRMQQASETEWELL